MAFCPNCGAPANGRFCGTCGASIPTDGGSTPPPPSGPGPAGAGTSEMPDNIAGALCYLVGPITGILFLVLEPYNRKREIRFHAWQSILLFGGLVVLSMALSVFGVILPTFITVLLGFSMMLLSLASFLAWLFLMYQTYNGQRTVLPIIGPIAEQRS